MNVKYLAAAVAAIGATGANAAALNPATDTPDVIVYIAGASAQANAIANVMPTAVFSNPAEVVQINGSMSTGPDLLGLTVKVSSQAWFGMSIPSLMGTGTAAVSKKLLVIYNNTNGSAAGLRQLIDPTNFTTIEHLNITVPMDAGCTAAAGTIATPDGSLVMPNYVCNVLSPIAAADVGLSDVAPTEFATGIVPSGPNTLTTKRTGLEGFGVMVNPALYTALQTQNVADGLLASTCVGVNTLACQPSIRSADYAAVANQANAAVASSSLVVPAVAAAPIKLCRRDIYSGSQASSNLFFLNSVCGTKGYGGFLADARAADSTANLTVVENVTGGAVTSCIGNATGYAMGVASTGTGEAATNSDGSRNYRFVKIDGVTPLDGGKNRTTLIRGDYKFGVDMTASFKKTVATGTPVIRVANAVINSLVKTSASDLAGIGYEDPAGVYPTDGKTAKYTHGGNNCSPLH